MEVGRSSSHLIEIFDEANDHSITGSIKPMFDNVPQSSSDYFISRVPERLRSVKPEAYTPVIVSIGPFHRGDARLKTMEHLKTQYLHSLLRQHPEISLDRYVKKLLKLETRARNCYAETIPYTKEEFVQMLLLDGCFLLELFRKYCLPYGTPNNDRLFTNRWIFNAVHRDVLLLENQIPFFVLETLFDVLAGKKKQTQFGKKKTQFNVVAGKRVLPPTGPREIHDLSDRIEVFLGLHKLLGDRDWHICRLKEKTLLLSVLKSITAFETDRERTTPKSQTTIAQFHSKFLRFCCPFPGKILPFRKKILLVCCQLKTKFQRVCCPFKKKNPMSLTFIPSATELSRVGITFEKSESPSIFAVIFEGNGVFNIPSLVVNDRTESFLRNLIALEQTSSKTRISWIKDQNQSLSNKIPTISAYVTLMDCLVNTCADVQLLRDERILYNQLGDDKEVAQLFNKLRTGIIMNPDELCFSEVFKCVNVYYHTKWNEWRALFFREFWSTPWRKTSLFGAILLLLLTLAQTVCSILQFLPPWSN